MPDREAPTLLPYNTFASGEVAPGMYGRQDAQKYASGCMVMRNWYVSVQGGASVRPGSQYIGQAGATGYVRLIPFNFSPAAGQSYALVFSANNLRFVKNPGTPSYPNSSNAGFVLTGGGAIYEISTPYGAADLRNINYFQIADVMWLTCRGHPRYKLSRLADNSWTLAAVSYSPSISPPGSGAVVVSDPPSGTTPVEETFYMYRVSAVSATGEESTVSDPIVSAAGINIATVQGTVTVSWAPVTGASYYKVWKALPTHNNRIPLPHEQLGFAGYSYGTTFTDSNIVADFAQSPLQEFNPFASAPIVGYAISASGSGYTMNSTTLVVSDSTGSGAEIWPVFSSNEDAALVSIVGMYIAQGGSGYTAPTIAAAGPTGTGFAATLSIGPSTGLNPSVVGAFQQRLIYASTESKPGTVFAGRPGALDDFRKSNPPVDNDSMELALFDEQVSAIQWVHSLPGGLLIGTNSGIKQLTGGSASAGNPVALTPTNAVVVPQSDFGAANVDPIVIGHNVLYVQTEGIVRELNYNLYANIYTGFDLTTLSSHLFQGISVIDWAYQDKPNKIVWMIMSNGQLLSLTYLKSQELLGWARHDTTGVYESIVAVKEGNVDAIYFSVVRGGVRWIERQTTQYLFQASDAWQLDGAISTAAVFPAADLTFSALTGGAVTVTASASVFVVGDVGKLINAVASRATITNYTNGTTVTVAVDAARPFGSLTVPQGLWSLHTSVSSVSGLAHMNGMSVYALVDGVVQGPFTVSGGAITLTTAGFMVVVGLRFTAQLQPMFGEPPGSAPTVQGRLKKVTAAVARVHNTKGLRYGPTFASLSSWTEGVSSTDPTQTMPYAAAGLYTGDQRVWLDQSFSIGGWVCVQQDQPYPATVLALFPEVAQGDAM